MELPQSSSMCQIFGILIFPFSFSFELQAFFKTIIKVLKDIWQKKPQGSSRWHTEDDSANWSKSTSIFPFTKGLEESFSVDKKNPEVNIKAYYLK